MTNINLKDGQEVPKQIHHQVGGLHIWNFSKFVDENMESFYKRGKYKKTNIMFVDGYDNNFLTTIANREGKRFPKEDHWVEIYGYTIMPVVWKPSGKIKFATYGARDKTSYKYDKKKYPQATWMMEVPKWVREK